MENIHYVIFNLVYISENISLHDILLRRIKHMRYGSTLLGLVPVCLVCDCSYVA
jgi:hypothetical protein